MKRVLLFTILSIVYVQTLSAQTKTWIGAAGGNFNVASNWNPNGIPDSNHDVIIPTGSDMNFNVASSIKSFTIQGNAVVKMTQNISFTNDSSIASSATFNGMGGSLQGSGTLTNNGILNDNGIVLANSITVLNKSIYNVNSDGTHYLGYGTPILNNTTTGTINLKSSNASFSGASGYGIIKNSGVIKRSQGTGAFIIYVPLENLNGILEVQSGKLKLQNENTQLNGGIYNISSGANLEWASTFTCTGILQGNVQGELIWNGILKVLATKSATLNFTNSPFGIKWINGTFNGDGTLTNTGIVSLETTASKVIGGQSEFKNQGLLILNANFNFYLGYGTPTLNNTSSGTIAINSPGSITGASGYGSVVNSGIIKRSSITGTHTIYNPLQNNDGTFLVEKGILVVKNNQTQLSSGTYNVESEGTLSFESTFTCIGTLKGLINGNLEWSGNLKVLPGNEAILNFSGPKGFKWLQGTFDGDGTLTNKGILNFESSNSKVLGGQSLLKNEGIFNLKSDFNLYLGYGTPTLKNTTLGTINLQTTGTINGASGYGTLINEGIINRNTITGLYTIYNPIKNNDGTITVDKGILKMTNVNTELTDGTFNVATEGQLIWDNVLTCLGTLTGQLNGILEWTGNLKVLPEKEATLNFTGPSGIKWTSGTFNGDGTLINKGILNLESANSKVIGGQSIFKNEGTVNILNPFTFYLGYGTPTFKNTNLGVFNIASTGSMQGTSGYGTFINSGIIKKDGNNGEYTIAIPLENISTGEIIADLGNLKINNTFTGPGIFSGNGSVQLNSSISFEGKLSPGGTPGSLTHINNFKSSPNALFFTEILGPIQGDDHDRFLIQGNADLQGNVEVDLFYAPNLNDEFIVITSNSITNCNLSPTTSTSFEERTYTFDVLCNDTDVILKVSDIVMGINENEMIQFAVYPNPTKGIFTLDLGKEYSEVTIQIYSMTGKMISSKKYNSAKIINQEINAPAGIYILKINSPQGISKSIKIVKK